jgi:hypothetical protein
MAFAFSAPAEAEETVVMGVNGGEEVRLLIVPWDPKKCQRIIKNATICALRCLKQCLEVPPNPT